MRGYPMAVGIVRYWECVADQESKGGSVIMAVLKSI